MEANLFNIIELSIMIVSILISVIAVIISIKTKNRYEKYVNKLGNGDNIAETLKEYINQVNDLNKKDEEIIEYCKKLNIQVSNSYKKIGLIRYDTYCNTKNKLSFALAILDTNNNGIVINSIYGADNSNVYAKSVENGISKYQLSSEEQEALNKAMKIKNK